MELSPVHDHERTDAGVKPLVIFLIGVTVMVAFSVAFTWLLFELFEQRALSKTNPASPVQIIDAQPSGPQLEVTPGLNLRQRQQEVQQRYDGYGWVDEGAGVAHIPVEEAIDLLVEKGLPVRGEEAAAAE